jgi:hypothetical protein
MRAWPPLLAVVLACGPQVAKKTPPGPPPAKPSCLSGAATRPLLTWARGTELVDAFADGSTKTAHAFSSGAQVDVLTGANGLLLASAKTATGREAVLFDATGSLRWTQSLAADATPSLGTDGWIVTAGAQAKAIDAEGNLYPLQGTPLNRAGMDGWVPTLIQPLGIVALEHPFDGTVNTLNAPPAGSTPDVRWAGDRVVYLTPGSPAMQLVSARQAGQQQQLALGAGFEEAHLVATSGQFVLIASDDGSHLIRADVVNQQVQTIASVFPTTWTPVDSLFLDNDGSVVRGFTNATSSSLFVSADFGQDWTPIGNSFPTTSGFRRVMNGQHLSQSWVVSAFDVDGEVTTLADAMMVSGSSVDMLEAGAIGFGAPLDTPVLDSAGTCAAYWKPDGPDARTATQAELRIHGPGAADVSLSTESVPLTSWSRVVWR